MSYENKISNLQKMKEYFFNFQNPNCLTEELLFQISTSIESLIQLHNYILNNLTNSTFKLKTSCLGTNIVENFFSKVIFSLKKYFNNL
jgi:hypothetical protein